ncbi:protein FAM8A1 [Anthonomus grandis grandis]|uniref:protein FAM8A1 n=1 Tax=Anthonomus grandis grandis TaxID=2921223 RepID=UPI002165F125|nr:protein FAM8A1 [Anthonomus grandis grandis]
MEKLENKPATNRSSPAMDWHRKIQERDEYFEKLRQWLDEARSWYSFSAAGFSNPLSGEANGYSQQYGQYLSNSYATFYQAAPLYQHGGTTVPNQQAQTGNAPANNTNFNGVPMYQTYPFMIPPNLLRLPTTFELKIPPIWKRIVAELIDFCILLTLKLALTFLFLESFNLGNALDLYGLDVLQKGILEGEDVNLSLAFELVMLEFTHRFLVCVFETYFLKGKICATPGKRCMGLMVVSVDTLVPIPNRTDVVTGTGVKPPGWQKALIRAILKNLIVGLLFPLCATFYLFPCNRTTYDMVSNTVVVEIHPEFLVYQALLGR